MRTQTEKQEGEEEGGGEVWEERRGRNTEKPHRGHLIQREPGGSQRLMVIQTLTPWSFKKAAVEIQGKELWS